MMFPKHGVNIFFLFRSIRDYPSEMKKKPLSQFFYIDGAISTFFGFTPWPDLRVVIKSFLDGTIEIFYYTEY